MQMKRSILIIAAVMAVIAAGVSPAAAAYAHNETIWTSFGNQFLMESFLSGATGEGTHYANGYSFGMKPGGTIVLVTPFTSPSVRDGVHPKLRYITFDLELPVGVNATHISVFSGPAVLCNKDIRWTGTGTARNYQLDMGSHKSANRGITAAITIQNDLLTSVESFGYGAGAKLEW
jgi:hypothetical protein